MKEDDQDGLTVVRDFDEGSRTGRGMPFTGAVVGLLIICAALVVWRILA